MSDRTPWQSGFAIFDDSALRKAIDYTPRVKRSEMWAHLGNIAVYFALVGAVQDAMAVWRLAYSDPIPIPERGDDAAVSALCFASGQADLSQGRPRADYLAKPEDLKYRVARYDRGCRRGIACDRWHPHAILGPLVNARAAIELAKPPKGHAYNERDLEALPYFDAFIASGSTPSITSEFRLLCCDIAARHNLKHAAVAYLRSWYEAVDPLSSRPFCYVALWEVSKLCFEGTLMEMSGLTAEDRKALVIRLTDAVKPAMSPDAPKPVHVSFWPSFLQEFNARYMTKHDQNWTTERPPHLGRPGATEDQIAAAEARLKVTLPSSYRQFLIHSNGWAEMGVSYPGELRSVDVIGRLGKENDVLDDSFEMDLDELRANTDDKFTIARKSPNKIIEDSIQISEWGDVCVLLLSPDIVGEDGEWYCLEWASWHPGFEFHTSFAEWFRGRFDALPES